MELCERYLHYMSALCEGTMPAPPELALTADTTEERAAQLQSALKSMSVPDFVRLCAKSAGDELDEAIFNHFSEEDFSRALLQMLNAAAELEQPEEKPPAAESTPDPDAGKHAFEVFCDCVELDEQLVAYLIDILKCGDKAAFYKLSQVTTDLEKLEAQLPALLEEIFRARGDVMLDVPQYLGVQTLDASGIVLRFWVKVAEKNIYAGARALNRELLLGFRRLGVECPFPQMDVHMK